MEMIKEKWREEPLYLSILALVGLAFLIKGVDYLMLQSLPPFILGVLMVLGLLYTIISESRLSRRLARVIAVFLIFWGFSRLAVELMFSFTSVTEAHIRSQFTWVNRLLSALSLFAGFYIYRKQNLKN